LISSSSLGADAVNTNEWKSISIKSINMNEANPTIIRKKKLNYLETKLI